MGVKTGFQYRTRLISDACYTFNSITLLHFPVIVMNSVNSITTFVFSAMKCISFENVTYPESLR